MNNTGAFTAFATNSALARLLLAPAVHALHRANLLRSATARSPGGSHASLHAVLALHRARAHVFIAFATASALARLLLAPAVLALHRARARSSLAGARFSP
jgi:hypothetical protein